MQKGPPLIFVWHVWDMVVVTFDRLISFYPLLSPMSGLVFVIAFQGNEKYRGLPDRQTPKTDGKVTSVLWRDPRKLKD